jgi:CheY-like chemotaxis protein
MVIIRSTVPNIGAFCAIPQWERIVTEPHDACILVVENDVLIRNLISTSLNNDRHFVLAAANQTEALELSRTFPGEIRLLIANSPCLAQGIAAERPNARKILLSAVTSAELKAIVRTVHPVAFLGQATLPQKLRDVIQQTVTDTTSNGIPIEV